MGGGHRARRSRGTRRTATAGSAAWTGSAPKADRAAAHAVRILVTGGGGFLGSHLVERLAADGHDVVRPRGSADYDLTRRDDTERLFEDAAPGARLPPRSRGRRHRREPREPRPLLVREPDDGRERARAEPDPRGREARHRRHRLRIPEAHAGAVPRGRPLERLSGGDERALRHRQEGAPRRRAGLPRAVRAELDLPAADEPLRPARQLPSDERARDSGPDPKMLESPRTRSCSGATARRRGSSSTSRTASRASCSPPIATTGRTGQPRGRQGDLDPRARRARRRGDRLRGTNRRGTRRSRTGSRGGASMRRARASSSASRRGRRSATGSSERSPGTASRLRPLPLRSDQRSSTRCSSSARRCARIEFWSERLEMTVE